jgi:hypothetical protein
VIDFAIVAMLYSSSIAALRTAGLKLKSTQRHLKNQALIL